jgi:hypothetical protein
MYNIKNLWSKLERILYYAFNNPKVIHITEGYMNRYSYNEPDDIFIHAAFQVLIDYVDIECALNNPDNKNKRYILSYVPLLKCLVPPKRSAKHGTGYLMDEAELYEKDSKIPKDDVYCTNPSQILLFLYLWWTVIRPSRKSSWVESGLADWAEKNSEFDMLQFIRMTREEKDNSPIHSEFKKLSDKRAEIESSREEEDTKMLQILVANRHYMWT